MQIEKLAQIRKPASWKVVKNQENQLLLKYGHAYFALCSIQKFQVSSILNALLHSYPCWFMKQSLLQSQQFQKISSKIISVDAKEVYLFQEKQPYNHFSIKFKILSTIDSISFTNLKIIHIMLIRDNNFQQIGWLNAPVLEQLYVSTHGSFTSIKPLQKSDFKHLYLVNFRVAGEDKKREGRMFQLNNFHRTRMLSRDCSQLPKAKIYTPPGTMSVCRSDFSNIPSLAKLQLSRLTNFHIPHLQLAQNQHHRFTPNVQYPWCPQLQFCQCRLYRALNRRFDNKTIALSIVDYVLDQNLDYEHRFLRRNRVLDEGSDASDEGDREEVDSDLD